MIVPRAQTSLIRYNMGTYLLHKRLFKLRVRAHTHPLEVPLSADLAVCCMRSGVKWLGGSGCALTVTSGLCFPLWRKAGIGEKYRHFHKPISAIYRTVLQ